MAGRYTIFNDPEELERRVNEYFESCEKSREVYELKSGDIKVRQKRPNMAGLATFLNVNRDTLNSYINEEYKGSIDPEVAKQFSVTLSRARERIKDELLQSSLSGDVDSRIAALLLNAMGETQPEVSATVNVIIQGDSDAYSV